MSEVVVRVKDTTGADENKSEIRCPTASSHLCRSVKAVMVKDGWGLGMGF